MSLNAGTQTGPLFPLFKRLGFRATRTQRVGLHSLVLVFKFPYKPLFNQKGYTCYSWVTLGPGISFSDVCLSASLDLDLASPSVQWSCRLESFLVLDAGGSGRPMSNRRGTHTLHAPCAVIARGATSIRMLGRNVSSIHQREWSVGVLTACFCMEHVDSA